MLKAAAKACRSILNEWRQGWPHSCYQRWLTSIPPKKPRRTTYRISNFQRFFCFSSKTTTFVVSPPCAPVVDSFDLPHRCCPALEFLLGVSFRTKKIQKFRMRTFINMFFWKDSRRLRGAHFLYLNWQMEKCTNWSDLCFSALRNDHDFWIFVPSSGRKANFFGSHIFKQCEEQETF